DEQADELDGLVGGDTACDTHDDEHVLILPRPWRARMCTVIIRVGAGEVRLLAIRDEDPERPWQPLGASWPETHPGVVGVRDVRAGGAWLAADPARRRLAVLLNRADLSDRPESA